MAPSTAWLEMRAAAAALLLLALAACALSGPPVKPGAPESSEPSGTAAPAPPPYTPPARQYRLGPASSALVAQAHRQAGSGDYGAASATLERAQRIEPDNPLVWIELGRLNLAENNPAQADAMGRKALALATGDAAAQAAAWRLIAESYRTRGRNAEAADAERHAQTLEAR
jgi:tetratricopeptide (TPR) repeat protein